MNVTSLVSTFKYWYWNMYQSGTSNTHELYRDMYQYVCMILNKSKKTKNKKSLIKEKNENPRICISRNNLLHFMHQSLGDINLVIGSKKKRKRKRKKHNRCSPMLLLDQSYEVQSGWSNTTTTMTPFFACPSIRERTLRNKNCEKFSNIRDFC